MEIADARAALDALIRDRGEDYASLSRLIGRNAAYIQQFIKRGVPRKLDEEDRRTLARYFGVAESLLGAPEEADREKTRTPELVMIDRLEVGASAGPGALAAGERRLGRIGLPPDWLRRLGVSRKSLSFIQVDGDSMAPTLGDGDDILVDRSDAAERLRDGIYVLRIEDALIVKRVAVNPATRRFTIQSDNPAYPAWPDCDPGAVNVIGRVVWAGKRL